MKIHPHTRDSILADFARSPGANRQVFAAHQARLHGVSPRTIRRILERVERRPGGERAPRTLNDPEALQTLVALQAQTDLPVEHCRDIAEANGYGELPTASTIRRRIRRETGLTRKRMQQMRSPVKVRSADCIRMRAARSNQVWQLDFTVSEQYYIDAAGALAEYSPLTHSKNKQDKDQVKLWLYGLVDDHSSAVFAWFYAGLSSQNAVDFLVRAMGRKGPELLADQPGAPAWLRCPGVAPAPGEDRMDWFRDASFPFCGVPDMILTDNDVILKSEKTLFKAAFEHRLGGQIIHHLPGHSNVKGKVEVIFAILADFQKVTRLGKFQTLYEANAALMDYLLRLNNRRRALQTWLDGLDGLKVLDRLDLVRRLFLRQISVRIDNQVSFSYHGQRIYLPREEQFRDRVDETVDVVLAADYQAGDEVAVILDGREIWTQPIDAIVVNTGEQFLVRALPKTAAQSALETALATDLSHLQLTGIYHELPRYRQEYTVPTGESYRPESLQPVKGPARNILYAARRMAEEGLFHTEVTEDEARWLRVALFASRADVPDAELEEFIRQVKTGQFNVGDRVAVYARS